MNSSGDSPLHTSQLDRFVHLTRAHAAAYACAVLALFYHHYVALRDCSSFLASSLRLSLLASDAVLASMWALVQAARWRPVYRRVFPERLASKIGAEDYFPRLDVFVCTADPYREPPMGLVNTALSAMGYDYPANKLSVYVSDDSGSELTLFALMEAARFARHWLPFCKENGVEQRCPEEYFGGPRGDAAAVREKIEALYNKMKENVEHAVESGRIPEEDRDAMRKWSVGGFSPQEHPSIVQVLLDSSTDTDVAGRALPNLIYVAREKSSSYSHHFKAGALNALMRVSRAMSNGAVILTLDCDMFSSDPETPQQALCFLLDRDAADPRLAFVQFGFHFRRVNRDDIYGSQFLPIHHHLMGMDGISCPDYVGSGAFFSRGALDGSRRSGIVRPQSANGPISSEEVLSRAHLAAGCAHDSDAKWGSAMGFRCGTITEDFWTSYSLHREGWRSAYCCLPRPSFLTDMPISLTDALNQIKRWTVGSASAVFFSESEHCATAAATGAVGVFNIKSRRSLLMEVCYLHYALWWAWSVPILVYGIVPQLALFYQVPLFPKASDPWLLLHSYLFAGGYIRDLLDFVRVGETIRRWWNEQRMWMIKGVTSYAFGAVELAHTQLGISPLRFDVTSKAVGLEQSERYQRGVFDFGTESPFMVSLGLFAVVSLTSFAVGLARAIGRGNPGDFAAQLFLSGFVVVNCWPIYEAMVFRTDSGRMPRKSFTVSILLAVALFAAGYLIF